MRITLFLTFFIGVLPLFARATEPDTLAASKARNVQLKTKVTLDRKNDPLIDFLKALAEEVEKQQVKAPKWTYAPEVSRTLRVTYSCKDKPIEAVLAAVFKELGLGYVVVSQEDDKYDGFIRITKGTERGYARGSEPTEDDKLAAARLALARDLLKEGNAAAAKAMLGRIVKDYPTSGAAKEAARLLESIDK